MSPILLAVICCVAIALVAPRIPRWLLQLDLESLDDAHRTLIEMSGGMENIFENVDDRVALRARAITRIKIMAKRYEVTYDEFTRIDTIARRTKEVIHQKLIERCR